MADLEFSELIYSRSDPRGVILAGNAVFQRMTGYDWRQLIGAPHRLIRHPAMPRGFFHIFWQLLKSGQPAVGYVRNSRKEGDWYWVLACAIPCEGGYFSVRFRPSTPLWTTIEAEYARHLAREQAEGLTPEASAAILLARLEELGFSSIEDFEARALSAELRARNERLGRAPDGPAIAQADLLDQLRILLAEQGRLVTRFAELVLLPANMRLVAARLEPQGGPISQIAMNYRIAAEEIARRLSGFVSGRGNICGAMALAVRHSLILTTCAGLHAELIARYDREDEVCEGIDRWTERKKLGDVMGECLSRARTALQDAGTLATSLNDASVDLRRMILGLDTIRILARVESRKSAENQAALTATIDRIDVVQGAISESLRAMMERSLGITSALCALRRGSLGEAAQGDKAAMLATG